MAALLPACPAASSQAFGRGQLNSTKPCRSSAPQSRALPASICSQAEGSQVVDRRQLLQRAATSAAAITIGRAFPAGAATSAGGSGAGASTYEPKLLCDVECQSKLDGLPSVTTSSGLKYKDIVMGNGPTPPTGYQVTANYVATTPDGRVFDSSLDKGAPYIVRVGSGQVVAGLDEGLSTMKVGGLRRLYIPGSLSFPKGLPSGPGRPRVPPASPVIFDVQLLFIPGLDDEE